MRLPARMLSVLALACVLAFSCAAAAYGDESSDASAYLSDVAEVSLSASSLPWTGAAVKPSVTRVMLWGDVQDELQVGSGYELVGYRDNVGIGTGAVVLRCLVPGYTGTWEVPFSVTAPAAGARIGAGHTSDGNAYKMLANGTVSLSAYRSDKKSAAVGSVRFGGKRFTVSAVGARAFRTAAGRKVKRVVLGSHVKSVGAQAFRGCAKLASCTLGAGVAKIGAKAFKGCSKLETLTVKSGKLAKRGVRMCLQGSKVVHLKLVGVRALKRYVYRSYFAKRNSGRKVRLS